MCCTNNALGDPLQIARLYTMYSTEDVMHVKLRNYQNMNHSNCYPSSKCNASLYGCYIKYALILLVRQSSDGVCDKHHSMYVLGCILSLDLSNTL